MLVVLGLRVALARRAWLIWALLAIFLGFLTVRRNADYRSVLALYADTVAKRPTNAHAHNNLGQALRLAGRYAEAVASFQTALPLAPNRTLAHNYLALADRGQRAEAIRHLEEALRLRPDYPFARAELAKLRTVPRP